MEEWKRDISEQFQQWLAELEPEALESERRAEPREPDLYAFFETLSVMGSDIRKSTRRSQETFAKFAETLDRLEGTLASTAEAAAADRQLRERDEHRSRKAFLTPFAELLERIDRLQQRLDRPPVTGLFRSARKWNEAWSSFRQGFGLFREHLQQLLQENGIRPMDTVGRPFDPSQMKAVAVEETDAAAHNTVIEEWAAGYIYRNEVLKFAEVKIAIAKGSDR